MKSAPASWYRFSRSSGPMSTGYPRSARSHGLVRRTCSTAFAGVDTRWRSVRNEGPGAHRAPSHGSRRERDRSQAGPGAVDGVTRGAVGPNKRARQFPDARSGLEHRDDSGFLRRGPYCSRYRFVGRRHGEADRVLKDQPEPGPPPGGRRLVVRPAQRAVVAFPNVAVRSRPPPLPRLATSLEALPRDLHPSEAAGRMTTANGDLVVGDLPISRPTGPSPTPAPTSRGSCMSGPHQRILTDV